MWLLKMAALACAVCPQGRDGGSSLSHPWSLAEEASKALTDSRGPSESDVLTRHEGQSVIPTHSAGISPWSVEEMHPLVLWGRPMPRMKTHQFLMAGESREEGVPHGAVQGRSVARMARGSSVGPAAPPSARPAPPATVYYSRPHGASARAPSSKPWGAAGA